MRTITFAVLFLSALVGAQGVAPLGDGDGDGLCNIAEAPLGLDPLRQDTDGDGVSDGIEATAPGGDGRDAKVTAQGRGARLIVWRVEGQAWVLLVLRPGTLVSARGTVFAPLIGKLPIEGLFRPVAQSQDGVSTWAIPFPAEVLTALGGNLMLEATVNVAEPTGTLRAAGSLVSRPGGLGWILMEADASGRMREMAAEVRSLGTFPVPAHTGPRTCRQVSEELYPIPGEWGYSMHHITDENCGAAGPECVSDCGSMVGYRFIWLTP